MRTGDCAVFLRTHLSTVKTVKRDMYVPKYREYICI